MIFSSIAGESDAGDRKSKLNKLLGFLGANPIEKIDKAFSEKFKTGILAYLDLDK